MSLERQVGISVFDFDIGTVSSFPEFAIVVSRFCIGHKIWVVHFYSIA